MIRINKQITIYDLQDADINIVAHLIETDSVYPADDAMTFAILDSFCSKNKNTRDRFYPTVRSIIRKADGSLAESIGYVLQRHVIMFPIEFFNRYSTSRNDTLLKEEFDDITQFVKTEIVISPEPYVELEKVKEVVYNAIPNMKVESQPLATQFLIDIESDLDILL